MKSAKHISIYPNIEIPKGKHCKISGKKLECDHLEEIDTIIRCNVFYKDLKKTQIKTMYKIEKCDECIAVSNKRDKNG